MSAPQIQTTATDYKPWGLTAGAIVGQDQYDKEAANIQAIKESKLNNVVNKLKAIVAQGQMDNPDWLQAKLAGEIGQSRSLEATGKFDTQTLDGKIKSQVAEYAAKVPESKFKQEQAEAANRLSAMTRIYSSLEANQWNPGAIQAAAQQAGPELGIPQEMLSKFVGLPPQELKKALEHFMSADKQLVTFTPQVRQKMAEQEQAGVIQEGIHAGDRRSHEKIASGNNSTSIQVANINAQSRLDAAKMKGRATDIIAQAQAGKLSYERAATSLEIMASFTDDPTEAAKYKDLASRFDIANQKSRAAGRQVPVDLGAMGVQTQTVTSNLGSKEKSGRPPLSSFNK